MKQGREDAIAVDFRMRNEVDCAGDRGVYHLRLSKRKPTRFRKRLYERSKAKFQKLYNEREWRHEYNRQLAVERHQQTYGVPSDRESHGSRRMRGLSSAAEDPPGQTEPELGPSEFIEGAMPLLVLWVEEPKRG